MLLFQYICFISPRYNVSLICYKKGDLIAELPKTVAVYVINLGQATTFFGKLLRKCNKYFTLPYILAKFKKHIWYINTIVLPSSVKYAVQYQVDFILHVHELKHMYVFLTEQQLKMSLTKPTSIIANSRITKEHLLNAGSNIKMHIINPFIDLELINKFKLGENNFSSSNFCWLMAGTIDSNKNPELFISIAKHAHEHKLQYQFVWLYNSVSDNALFASLQLQLNKLGSYIRFIKTNHYEDYLLEINKANGLLLTSSHESFSILTIEALAMNLAIVVNDCGGVREIVSEKTATIIELNSHLDVYLDAMKKEAERLVLLTREKENIVRNFDKTRALMNWEHVMENYLN